MCNKNRLNFRKVWDASYYVNICNVTFILTECIEHVLSTEGARSSSSCALALAHSTRWECVSDKHKHSLFTSLLLLNPFVYTPCIFCSDCPWKPVTYAPRFICSFRLFNVYLGLAWLAWAANNKSRHISSQFVTFSLKKRVHIVNMCGYTDTRLVRRVWIVTLGK